MITPRTTRLLRVPDLAAYRTTLAALVAALTPVETPDTLIVVPTRAAAEQLGRTLLARLKPGAATSRLEGLGLEGLGLEGLGLEGLGPEGLEAFKPSSLQAFKPVLATRAELYEELASRLAAPPRRLSLLQREVILAAAARQLQREGIVPPFNVRPALIAEMLALYDFVRRLGRSVDDFERNMRLALEPDTDTDRGAAKLLQQTEFLAAAFRRYERRVADDGAADEHVLRSVLLAEPAARPLTKIIITVADRVGEPDGLWPADFDLLTKLPALSSIDVVCTEGLLGAGMIERLRAALPELEDVSLSASRAEAPILICSRSSVAPPPPAFTYRDREDELAAVARRLKADRRAGDRTPLDRMALVVRRPLPYLYVARDVFADAGIPFEARHTLPLAAEPYAAAVDLVLDAVVADFSRASLLALLRSPHFTIGAAREAPPQTARLSATQGSASRGTASFCPAPRGVDISKGQTENLLHSLRYGPLEMSSDVSARAVAALDSALVEVRYHGGLARFEAIVNEWASIDQPASREERRRKTAAPVARALLAAVRGLAPLTKIRPLTEHIDTLLNWLTSFDRPANDAMQSRRLRARAAVIDAFSALRDAYSRHDSEASGDAVTLSAEFRRWVEAQTFAVSSNEEGLHIVDASAARYGEFDDVQLVGLIDGEWPERARRNVLYPASLLAPLEPLPAGADPLRRERDALNAAVAAFRDLLRLPGRRLRLSTFLLENDAVVEPSLLLDEVGPLGLTRQIGESSAARVFQSEALAIAPRRLDVLPPDIAAWAAARLATGANDPTRFRGEAGAWTLPRVSVSRLERYLDCPFRFFASEVLRLEEQPEDEDTRTPLERGRFLHELFETFFAEWQRRGHGRIEPDLVSEARMLFASICDTALAALSPAEAALERARLLGSALSPGIAHRVFAIEADRPVAIHERLLEFPLQGDFTFRRADGQERTITLSAQTDRLDVLADGTLRVIDYKSKKTPELKSALQLPIYSLCARDTLERRGQPLTLAEAMYLSFEGDRAVVPLRAKGRTIDELIADAQDRLLRVLDRIAEGHFPASPARRSLCGPCPYDTVCRLERIEVDDG